MDRWLFLFLPVANPRGIFMEGISAEDTTLHASPPSLVGGLDQNHAVGHSPVAQRPPLASLTNESAPSGGGALVLTSSSSSQWAPSNRRERALAEAVPAALGLLGSAAKEPGRPRPDDWEAKVGNKSAVKKVVFDLFDWHTGKRSIVQPGQKKPVVDAMKDTLEAAAKNVSLEEAIGSVRSFGARNASTRLLL